MSVLSQLKYGNEDDPTNEFFEVCDLCHHPMDIMQIRLTTMGDFMCDSCLYEITAALMEEVKGGFNTRSK